MTIKLALGKVLNEKDVQGVTCKHATSLRVDGEAVWGADFQVAVVEVKRRVIYYTPLDLYFLTIEDLVEYLRWKVKDDDITVYVNTNPDRTIEIMVGLYLGEYLGDGLELANVGKVPKPDNAKVDRVLEALEKLGYPSSREGVYIPELLIYDED